MEPRKNMENDAVVVSPKPLLWHQKILRSLHLTKDVAIYMVIIAFLVSGYVIKQATLKERSLRVKAGTNTVKISIQPATSTMPPNTTYQLWATADNPVIFATVKITFDPKIVKMIAEISTTPSPLTRVVRQTAMSEANTTGIINLSLALDPTKKSTPPIGTFELGTIAMAPNTVTSNLSTTLHLDNTVMQVVNPDSSLFTITTVDGAVTLNPPPTPTPTPIPSVTPSPTPTPVASDTVPPVVTITTPTDGATIPAKGSITIKASASDVSGISTITLAIDGSIQKTCLGATDCQFNIAVTKISTGSHTITATATDNSASKNTASSTIHITK